MMMMMMMWWAFSTANSRRRMEEFEFVGSSLPTWGLATASLALLFFATTLSSFPLTSSSSGGQGSLLDVVADPTVWINASDANHTLLSFLG